MFYNHKVLETHRFFKQFHKKFLLYITRFHGIRGYNTGTNLQDNAFSDSYVTNEVFHEKNVTATFPLENNYSLAVSSVIVNILPNKFSLMNINLRGKNILSLL